MEFDGIRKTLHQIDKIRYRPSILRKIAYGYFRTLVLRKPTLRIIEFSITPACQSGCGYCYASKFQRSSEKLLSVDEIRDTWVQAKKLGAFTGFVVGGEPSLHKNFLDIVRVLEPMKHMVSFATNCISLTEEMVIEAKKMGVFVIYVSLNSVDPVTNDIVRGYYGHFDHAMRVIDLCKKHEIDVMIERLPVEHQPLRSDRSSRGRQGGPLRRRVLEGASEALRPQPRPAGRLGHEPEPQDRLSSRLREGPRQPVRRRDGLRHPAHVLRQRARAAPR
jgi:hypothetical protein